MPFDDHPWSFAHTACKKITKLSYDYYRCQFQEGSPFSLKCAVCLERPYSPHLMRAFATANAEGSPFSLKSAVCLERPRQKENQLGKVMYPGTISYQAHKLCDQAGLLHRTVHSLRHTNTTMQIAAGVPLVTVASRAGHARTSTTTDIYSHFLKSSDKTAAEKLEQMFE